MKYLLILLLLPFVSNSQVGTFDRVSTRSIFIGKSGYGRNVDSIRNDTVGWFNRIRSIPTAHAVYEFVNGRMSGGGGGGGDAYLANNQTFTGQNTFSNSLIKLTGLPSTDTTLKYVAIKANGDLVIANKIFLDTTNMLATIWYVDSLHALGGGGFFTSSTATGNTIQETGGYDFTWNGIKKLTITSDSTYLFTVPDEGVGVESASFVLGQDGNDRLIRVNPNFAKFGVGDNTTTANRTFNLGNYSMQWNTDDINSYYRYRKNLTEFYNKQGDYSTTVAATNDSVSQLAEIFLQTTRLSGETASIIMQTTADTTSIELGTLDGPIDINASGRTRLFAGAEVEMFSGTGNWNFYNLDSISGPKMLYYDNATSKITWANAPSSGGSGTDSAAHHTIRPINATSVGFPKLNGGEDTLVINAALTMQQVYDSQIGGSILTKNDTIINKNSEAIIRNVADGASGNFNFTTLDTITATDPYGDKSRFGLYHARTLRFPVYNSTMNYKNGAGFQLNYEIKDSAFMQTWGGDFGVANKSIIKLRKMAGYSGRSLFIGGPNSTEVVSATLSDLSVSDPTSTVGNYRYARGWWGGNQAFLFMNSYDTLEKWMGNISAAGLFGNAYADYTFDYFGGKLGEYPVANVKNPWFLYNYSARSKSFIAGATGIGDSTIEASSILDISSTTKGVLMPRMTSAQRTAITGVAGLILFDTDSASYFQYTGSAWQNLYNTGGGGGSTTFEQAIINGNSLSADRTIALGTNVLNFSHSGSSAGIQIVHSSGAGQGLLATNNGTGAGLEGRATGGGLGFIGRVENSTTNTFSQLGKVQLFTSGTPAANIGGYFSIDLPNGVSASNEALRLVAKRTTVTAASENDDFEVWSKSSGTMTRKLSVLSTGEALTNNGADTLATKAYARSVGGGGGGISTLNTLTPSTQTFSGTGITISSVTANHAFSNDFSTGKAGGLTVTSGVNASDNMTLSTTTNATKGSFIFGSTSDMVYDDAGNQLRIGNNTAYAGFDLVVANNWQVGRSQPTPVSKFTFSNNTTGSTALGFYTSTDVLQGLLRANGPSIGGTLGGISKNNMFEIFANAGPLMLFGNSLPVYISPNNTAPALTAISAGRIGLNAITAPTAWLHVPAGTAAASSGQIKLDNSVKQTVKEAGTLTRVDPQLVYTNGGGVEQELFQGQQSRVSTQFDKTNTTLADVTGLTATLVAGKIYRFEAKLYTTSDVGGGVKVAIAGTATATAIIYEGLTINAGTTTQSRGTALATTVGAVTAVTAAYITITGTITCNAAGTLTVQFAQNASNATASSVLVGSTFIINEMP